MVIGTCSECCRRRSVSTVWWSHKRRRVPVCSRCLPGFIISRRWKNAQLQLVTALRKHDYGRALRLATSGYRLAENATGGVHAELLRDAAHWEAEVRLEMGDFAGAVRPATDRVRRSPHDWTEDTARMMLAEALALCGKRRRASEVMDIAIRHALAGGEETWDTHAWHLLLGAYCLLGGGQSIDRHHLEALQRVQVSEGMDATTPPGRVPGTAVMRTVGKGVDKRFAGWSPAKSS